MENGLSGSNGQPAHSLALADWGIVVDHAITQVLNVTAKRVLETTRKWNHAMQMCHVSIGIGELTISFGLFVFTMFLRLILTFWMLPRTKNGHSCLVMTLALGNNWFGLI